MRLASRWEADRLGSARRPIAEGLGRNLHWIRADELRGRATARGAHGPAFDRSPCKTASEIRMVGDVNVAAVAEGHEVPGSSETPMDLGSRCYSGVVRRDRNRCSSPTWSSLPQSVIAIPWTSNGNFSMETTLEVLTIRKSGREVHRHWPDEVKALIASESLRPNCSAERRVATN